TIWYAGHHALGVNKYWTNSLIEFQYFAVGALLALLLHGREFQPNWAMRAALFAGAVAAFLLLVFRFPVAAPDRIIHTPGLFAAFLLLGAVGVCGFLGCYGMRLPPAGRWFIYLGRISYGLYVFHLFALQACEAMLRRSHLAGTARAMAHLASAMVLTVGLAALSYSFLETPFLRLKARFTFVHSRDA
ncbi:MAG: acyltransferase family protein, partial [Janthinobacterium lividum]